MSWWHATKCSHSCNVQADCVKHRSEVIQSLTPQEFGQIWKGFSESKFCLSCGHQRHRYLQAWVYSSEGATQGKQ